MPTHPKRPREQAAITCICRAGLAALLAFQGDNEPDLVRVIGNIDLTTPYYLLMHRDMQQTPRVRAFADFVGSEIKSFRALVGKAIVAPR